MRTFLLLTLVLTANVFSYSLTNQEKDDFKASFNGEIIDFYGEGKAFLPNDIKGHILSSSESLYLNGYTDSIGYAKIKCKSDELFKIHDFIKSTSHPKDEECNFNSFSNTSCNTQVNLNAYKNVTNQNCSNAGFARIGPVVKKIDTSFGPKPLSKRFELWGKIYSRYQEFLIKTLNEHPGVRKNIRENSTVSACKEGLVRDYDFRSLSGASCKSTQVSCSDHLDCCSGRCIKSDVTDSTGQCSEAMTCYRPINLNRRCGDISGDGYNNTHCKSGECIEIDYNSSDMGALKRAGQSCSENMQCRSDLCSSGKCTEQSKCLECAANGESPSSSKSCCPGLIKSIKNKCIPDFPALILPTVQNERNIIEKVFNFIIPSALAEDPNEGDCSGVGTNLSPEDERAYEEELNRCMRIEDTEGRDACLVAAAKARQEKLDQQAQDSGCTWNREKYRDKYNTIEIKSKTYSNVEKCEFNSFNDTWKDMSNVQRNAELVVRAFEYVYSGAGTEDYWIDSNGKNINTRASEIAKGLRKARADFIKKMDETDIAMTCQCINVFGISNMPAEKQAFYNTSACDEFRVETAPIGAIVQETPDNGQGAEEGESSLATSDEVAEIDAGATGLSLEAALVEWLRIKYENQMERFELNSKLEQQMSEIVEQLDNQNFQSAKEEPNHLYNFTVYKPRGFWRFLQQAFTWPVYVIKRVFNGR